MRLREKNALTKARKKEDKSSTVNLKAVSTDVGLPNHLKQQMVPYILSKLGWTWTAEIMWSISTYCHGHCQRVHIEANQPNFAACLQVDGTWNARPVLESSVPRKLALHCHFRPPSPPVVIGFNNQALDAPAYQISALLGNARLTYWWFNTFSRHIFQGPQTARWFPELNGPNYTKFRYNVGQPSVLNKFVLGLRYVTMFPNCGDLKATGSS